MYSLARRLVLTVLAVELLLTVSITATTLWYERAQRYQALDVMLRGRADSVMGAVEDAGDEADNIILDTRTFDVAPSDLYYVHEVPGNTLGHSANWTGPPKPPCRDPGRARTVDLLGTKYRMFCFEGVRIVDPDGPGPRGGIAHRVAVLYAMPLQPLHATLVRTARFLLLANSLVLLLTGALASLFIRRGIAPLKALAAEASRVSSLSWSFHPPPEARHIRELQTLVVALETLIGGLERSFLQQQQFVSDAAHELKTAVTVVKSSLQLMNFRQRTAGEYRTAVENCLRDCARMEELVYKMLMLASIETTQSAERLPAARPAHSIASSFRAAVEELQPLAELRGLHISCAAQREAQAVISSEDIFTLVQNLIMNAIEHSSPGGHIRVALESFRDTGARLTVRDNGSGIAPEHLPFLFHRFYRGDASRSRKSGGAGLGLAICKALVDAQGGHIRIESAPGQGTTVIVNLPSRLEIAAPELTTLSP